MAPEVSEELQVIYAALLDDALEPDQARAATAPLAAAAAERLEPLRARFAVVADTVAGAGGAAARPAADVGAALAAACYAAGLRLAADETLARAVALAEPGPQRDGFAAARRDPAAFTHLAHAIWLERRGKVAAARRARVEAGTSTREPALVRASGVTIAAIASRRAGRVDLRERGDRRRVIASVLFLLAMAAGVTAMVLRRPASSERWLAALGLGTEPGATVAAEALYRAALAAADEKAHDRDALAVAGAGLVRLEVARVPRPLRAEGLGAARQAMLRYAALPADARGADAARAAGEALLAWADELASGGRVADLEAARVLLGEGEGLGEALTAKADGRRIEITRREAELLAAAGESLHALALLSSVAQDARAFADADALWRELGDDPAVLRALEGPARHWASMATRHGRAARGRELLAALDEATRSEGGAQQVALAAAEAQAAAGEQGRAAATLAAAAPPGRLAPSLRLRLAGLQAAYGDLRGAETTLTGLLLTPLLLEDAGYRAALSELAAVRLRLAARLPEGTDRGARLDEVARMGHLAGLDDAAAERFSRAAELTRAGALDAALAALAAR